MDDYLESPLKAKQRYENDQLWLVTGDVIATGEMHDGSFLYVSLGGRYLLRGDSWMWVQVYYPDSALDELADVEVDDAFVTACYITGIHPVEPDDLRVNCWRPDTPPGERW